LARELQWLGYQVHLPQEPVEPHLGSAGHVDPQAIFDANVTEIQRADVIVAILDHPDPDSGTCWECGYAWRHGCAVIGLRTDLRSSGDIPGVTINLMLEKGCHRFIAVEPKDRRDIPALAHRVQAAIEAVLFERGQAPTVGRENSDGENEENSQGVDAGRELEEVEGNAPDPHPQDRNGVATSPADEQSATATTKNATMEPPN
jgi:hypothetical protein